MDAAAHRVYRERISEVLGSDKARAVVSALCAYDDTVALPAPEWAATASMSRRNGYRGPTRARALGAPDRGA